jgi:hypothetical protein
LITHEKMALPFDSHPNALRVSNSELDARRG